MTIGKPIGWQEYQGLIKLIQKIQWLNLISSAIDIISWI